MNIYCKYLIQENSQNFPSLRNNLSPQNYNEPYCQNDVQDKVLVKMRKESLCSIGGKSKLVWNFLNTVGVPQKG